MTKVKLVKKLVDKGFPVSSRHYATAHELADKKEKKAYPKGYEKLKKDEHQLKPKELMGRNTRSGKIEIEKKFSKYKNEIALHERIENKEIKKLNNRNKKK
jgi:hypothetical protein